MTCLMFSHSVTAKANGAPTVVRIKETTALELLQFHWEVHRYLSDWWAVLKATVRSRTKMTVSNDILTVIKISHQGYKD